jgi:hypothetical protein
LVNTTLPAWGGAANHNNQTSVAGQDRPGSVTASL